MWEQGITEGAQGLADELQARTPGPLARLQHRHQRFLGTSPHPGPIPTPDLAVHHRRTDRLLHLPVRRLHLGVTQKRQCRGGRDQQQGPGDHQAYLWTEVSEESVGPINPGLESGVASDRLLDRAHPPDGQGPEGPIRLVLHLKTEEPAVEGSQCGANAPDRSFKPQEAAA